MSNKAPKVDAGSWLVFLASAVALLLAVFVLVSSLINTIKKNSTVGEVDSTSLVAAASDNLKPIGVSSTSDAKPATATAARSGKEVYDVVCSVCHAAGVAGAPKLDDKTAWEPRAATGLDALMTTAINGKGAMPARGGNPSVTDAELKATILYMTKEAGFNLGGGDEPVATDAPAKVEEKTPKAETPTKAETSETEPVKSTVAEEAKEVIATERTKVEEPEAPVVDAVAATTTAVTAPATDLVKGKEIYNKTCFACHASGVAGSPKLDDKTAWVPRIAAGMDTLYKTALTGKGAMPPKGGNLSLADEDVKAAVDYMVSEVK